jgi:hypothetical protein
VQELAELDEKDPVFLTELLRFVITTVLVSLLRQGSIRQLDVQTFLDLVPRDRALFFDSARAARASSRSILSSKASSHFTSSIDEN